MSTTKPIMEGDENAANDRVTSRVLEFGCATASEMAAAMLKILADRTLHARLAQGARDRVLRHYSISSAESIFWRAFDERFPGLDRREPPEPAASSWRAASLSA